MNNILKDIVVDVKETIGSRVLLLDMKRLNSYKEGIKGEQEGLTFNCLSEKMSYEKIDVKIKGLMQLPFEFDGTPILVEFDGLEGKLWQDWSNKGEVRLSLTAKGIKPITAGKSIKIGDDKV